MNRPNLSVRSGLRRGFSSGVASCWVAPPSSAGIDGKSKGGMLPGTCSSCRSESVHLFVTAPKSIFEFRPIGINKKFSASDLQKLSWRILALGGERRRAPLSHGSPWQTRIPVCSGDDDSQQTARRRSARDY